MALFALNSRQIALRGFPVPPNIWLVSLLIGHRKSTNVDAIDSFISELMENKALKWKVLNNKNKPATPLTNSSTTQSSSVMPSTPSSSAFRLTQIFDDLTSNPIVINIEPLEQTHIDNLIETAVEEECQKDVQLLFDQMLEFSKLPSRSILNKLLEYFANTADRQRLDQLVNLCRRVDEEFVNKNSSLLHYKALLQWNTGNSSTSLQTFKAALAECSAECKPVIDHMLKSVVDETIGKKSEAVLLAVIEVGEFCLKERHDEALLCYVWEKSFQSQWFSDQEAAKVIFDKHEQLREAVAKRITSLCFACMQSFNTEPVYRLMELFLKHQMLPQCRQILIGLFEYHYWRRDLRACSEIIQNSIDLDVSLPETCNRKLLDLLLGRSARPPPTTDPSPKRKQKIPTKKFELKF